MPQRARVKKKAAGHYHHGHLREALLVAAERTIASSGAVSVTLREVAKLAGVSHAAAYRHFASKSALLAEVARRGFENLLAELTSAVERHARRNATDRLEAASVAYVGFALGSRGAYRVMFHASLKPFTHHPGLAEAASAALAVLQRLVAEGGAGAAPHTGDPVPVVSIWAALHGQAMLLMDEQLHGMFGIDAGDAERATREMMRWLLAPGRRASPARPARPHRLP